MCNIDIMKIKVGDTFLYDRNHGVGSVIVQILSVQHERDEITLIFDEISSVTDIFYPSRLRKCRRWIFYGAEEIELFHKKFARPTPAAKALARCTAELRGVAL